MVSDTHRMSGGPGCRWPKRTVTYGSLSRVSSPFQHSKPLLKKIHELRSERLRTRLFVGNVDERTSLLRTVSYNRRVGETVYKFVRHKVRYNYVTQSPSPQVTRFVVGPFNSPHSRLR